MLFYFIFKLLIRNNYRIFFFPQYIWRADRDTIQPLVPYSAVIIQITGNLTAACIIMISDSSPFSRPENCYFTFHPNLSSFQIITCLKAYSYRSHIKPYPRLSPHSASYRNNSHDSDLIISWGSAKYLLFYDKQKLPAPDADR